MILQRYNRPVELVNKQQINELIAALALRELGRQLAAEVEELQGIIAQVCANDPKNYWQRYVALERALDGARTRDGD
jgi:hypothetical protein